MKNAQADQLVAAGQAAQRAGRLDEAKARYRAALNASPDHPVALNALGNIALGGGDATGAAALFTRAAAADPASPDLRINLAKAHRTVGDDAAERAALEAALAIDQRHFMALVRLAELHERRGEHGDAIPRWSGVAALIAQMEPRPSGLDQLAAHAAAYLERQQSGMAAAIDAALAAALAELAPAQRRRFAATVDVAVGRRRVYLNEPTGLHVPFLPADEFFDRAHFPWLVAVEAETATIRGELDALLATDDPGLAPYISMPSGTPANKWSPLDRSLGWGALHLWKDGRRNDAACARCPETARILETLVPLSDMPGRTPTAFFSILRPRTRIPPHTGVSNARAIVHLPLIVPDGCTYRVGGDIRRWQVGEAWVFDDTIEHEAWNGSDDIRALLIFDVWNPYLTDVERDLLRRFFVAADATGHGPRARAGD